MKIIKDQNEFKQLLTQNKYVLVDFFAEWCGPCKIMGPFFEAAAKEISDVAFYKLNVDEVESVAQEFEISSIPTMILFKDGKFQAQHVGFIPKDQILGFVNEAKK